MNGAALTSCPRCGLSVPAHALTACPRCLLNGLDEPEPLPENPQGLELAYEIGRGGMGRVFRARHQKLARDVAVKLLPSELAAESAFQARFEREARVLARLQHPHIVTVYDFGALPDGSGYLVMEYVAGGTLRSRLPLGEEEAERVAGQLCSALAYAHAAGIVHRDIKPENVLFDAQSNARLADFGIARLLVDDLATLTAPLVVLGTPRYMAPEARAGAPADPKSDVFAFGVLLQEMLGQAAPGSASTRRLRLEAIARRATSTQPSERYASAIELERALDGRPERSLAETSAQPSAAPRVLPAEQESWQRAVALTLAGATGVSLYAVLRSITPRILEPDEAIPLAIFEAQRLADGRLSTRARFETWPTLWASAAWAVALVAYGLLRGYWHRAKVDTPTPDVPLRGVRSVVVMALVLNALFALHLLLERTSLRGLVIYIPILGGMLELVMVYLVWVAVLEALRTARPFRREPWLWVAALISLIPPGVSTLRILLSSQP